MLRLRQSKYREKMCNCMVLDVTAIFFWITAFLTKLPFLAKGLPVRVPATCQWGEDSVAGFEDTGWFGARDRGTVGIAPAQMRPGLHNHTMGWYNNGTLFQHRQIRDCCPVHGYVHTLRQN